MNVVLVSTYELGHQPFGLASPAAWLRGRGHRVLSLDLSRDLFPEEAIRRADVVAFYLPMHTATRLALPVLEKVRALNPAARLAAFGLYAPVNQEFLRGHGVQAIVGGEFEAALARFVDGGACGVEVSLERLAFVTPDRAGLPPLERYATLQVDGVRRVAGYTEASRGCKHLCRHCPIVPVYQGTFRVVPRAVVLADVRQQVAAGARHITFGDPDFFNGPGHALPLVEAFYAEFPAITYDVTIKVEHLLKHRDLLPALKRTGCLLVTTAVESVDDAILERLDKGHTRAGFLEAVRLMREAELAVSPTFVAFTPWTTLEGYRELLRVIAEQDLIETVAPIQLAIRLLIPAGSRLLDLDEVRAGVTRFDPKALSWKWQTADRTLDEMAQILPKLIQIAEKRGEDRRQIFSRIWELAYGEPMTEMPVLPARATIPYLSEPWYC